MKSPIFEIARERLKEERNMLDPGYSMEELEQRLRKVVLELQEALVTSWVAETGLLPSESIIVSGPLKDGKWGYWIESKTMNDIRPKG